ncbi:MAG: hypothetical protein QM680_13690 [Luteolibacter sp.]
MHQLGFGKTFIKRPLRILPLQGKRCCFDFIGGFHPDAFCLFRLIIGFFFLSFGLNILFGFRLFFLPVPILFLRFFVRFLLFLGFRLRRHQIADKLIVRVKVGRPCRGVMLRAGIQLGARFGSFKVGFRLIVLIHGFHYANFCCLGNK